MRRDRKSGPNAACNYRPPLSVPTAYTPPPRSSHRVDDQDPVKKQVS